MYNYIYICNINKYYIIKNIQCLMDQILDTVVTLLSATVLLSQVRNVRDLSIVSALHELLMHEV